MTARPDTPTPGSLLWAVSETRRIIGDNGRAMLADLPAAVEARIAAARQQAFAECEGIIDIVQRDAPTSQWECAAMEIADAIAARGKGEG